MDLREIGLGGGRDWNHLGQDWRCGAVSWPNKLTAGVYDFTQYVQNNC